MCLTERSPSNCVSILPDIADEFSVYLNYCRSLKFEEKPDYKYLRGLFRNLFHRMGFRYDFQWDWLQTPRPDEYSIPVPGGPAHSSSSNNLAVGFTPAQETSKDKRPSSPAEQRKAQPTGENSDGSQGERRGAVTSRSAPGRNQSSSSFPAPNQQGGTGTSTSPNAATSFKRKPPSGTGTGAAPTKHSKRKDKDDNDA
jgi:hypothetical protein